MKCIINDLSIVIDVDILSVDFAVANVHLSVKIWKNSDT